MARPAPEQGFGRMNETLSGIISPNLTPFNEDLSIARDAYVRHARWLLDQGCRAITPFGTTGEALSLGAEERTSLLALLLESGIPADAMMVGTGLCSLPDTVTLTRHALDHGCRKVMVLPPFYYKGVTDEGLYRYFENFIEAVPEAEIYLYHIPPMSVVGFSRELVKRLVTSFPGQIVGLKDSGGDWEHTRGLIEEIPDCSIFPGSEMQLLDALRLGARGCITATANINAAAICTLFANSDSQDADEMQAAVRAFRLAVQPYGPIPAMKWLIADATGDASWGRVRPPLLPLARSDGEALKEALSRDFGFALDLN